MTTRARRRRTRPEPDRTVRVVATRRAEEGLPVDVNRLVALVLDIAEARYVAHQAGRSDPFGLPTPASVRGSGHNEHQHDHQHHDAN
jgi:hypothetical protein